MCFFSTPRLPENAIVANKGVGFLGFPVAFLNVTRNPHPAARGVVSLRMTLKTII